MLNNLEWKKQCTIAKANMVLGKIKTWFAYLDRQTLKPLYTTLVRPHLEYTVSIWCQSYKSDIETLEWTQKRATKLLKSIRKRCFEERLKLLNLQNLEDRSWRYLIFDLQASKWCWEDQTGWRLMPIVCQSTYIFFSSKSGRFLAIDQNLVQKCKYCKNDQKFEICTKSYSYEHKR